MAARQPRPTNLEPERADVAARPDEDELGAAAANVDDEELAVRSPPEIDAEEREIALLLVLEDIERHAGEPTDRPGNGRTIEGSAEGFRPDADDRPCTERPRALREPVDGDGKASARAGAHFAGAVDEGPQPEEDGFVDEWLEAVGAEGGDEEVDGVGADVDRSVDRRGL